MEHIQDLQKARQARVDHIRSTFKETTNVEIAGEISQDAMSALEKAGKINVFTPRAVEQMEIDINKAEDTGNWYGQKVSKDDISKAKDGVAKLQKKVVTDKNGGSKTVYIQVKSETKPHHKMDHEELMSHHSSQELNEIAENYRKNFDDVKTSVEKNGAADDAFKSKNATHSRGDVTTAEEHYMHIKQAAIKKEKLEKKAGEKGVKGVNQPVVEDDKPSKEEKKEIKKAEPGDIEKAFDILGFFVEDLEKGGQGKKAEKTSSSEKLHDVADKLKATYDKIDAHIEKNGYSKYDKSDLVEAEENYSDARAAACEAEEDEAEEDEA